jgi:NADH:ubiquinone oxidoreductase subunit C
MQKKYLQQIFLTSLPSIISIMVNRFTYLNLLLRSNTYVETSLAQIFIFLKKSSLLRLTMLTELTAYDSPSSVNRFTLIYFLLSVEYNVRLAININLLGTSIQSLTNVYLNSS